MNSAALVYNAVSFLILPFITLAIWIRYGSSARSRPGLHDRMGYLTRELKELTHGREVIWIHAVSVGETMAAKPLLTALRAARPEAVLLLSQGTETGREVALTADADAVFYLPLDLLWVVNRALRRACPTLLATIDTELWPNLFWRARACGAKVAVVNGRISEGAFAVIQRWRVTWVYRWCLSNASRLLMQSEADAERIRTLGGQNPEVLGNLKADEAFPQVTAQDLAGWQTLLGLESDQPVLLAGSTGPGEEAILLEAFAAIRASHPTARLVLVPRAIDRAAEIATLVHEAGHTPVLRSQLPADSERSRAEQAIVIVDTIGELATLYAVADVCFVGRSLVKLGGSNVLQAAAQGKPVLTGPYVSNMRDSVALLMNAGAARKVTDAESLAAATMAWFGDPQLARTIGARGRTTLEASQGAVARYVDALVELLDANPK
ncbi:MAG TPA: hypothetical protein DCZ72_13370 [Armatimonadetes bacterium]|nr:hypothetical protein [Armatimonadota bacterium]